MDPDLSLSSSWCVFKKTYWVENGQNTQINDDSNLSIVKFKIGGRIRLDSPSSDPCQNSRSCDGRKLCVSKCNKPSRRDDGKVLKVENEPGLEYCM